MPTPFQKLSIFLILLFMSGIAAAGGVDNIIVPVQHDIYDFLVRMETRGLVVFHGNCRPLSRGEIREALDELSEERGDLTNSEGDILERYMLEFKADEEGDINSSIDRLRKKVWANSPFYHDGFNLYNFRTGGIYGAVNPVLYYDFVTDSTGNLITRRTNGMNLITGFGESIGVYFDFRDNMESGRGPYNAGERDKLYSEEAGYITMKGEEAAYYDITRAVISAKFGNLRLNFGRGDNCWGDGESGGLLLSDNAPPYDYLSLRYDADDLFRFSYVTGWLHAYPEIYESVDTTSTGRVRKMSAAKQFSAHRVEIYPAEWVEIGIMESVVYGERGLEPSYLNPFNLYFSAEHNLGDMDNVAWGGDVEIRPVTGVSLYGELFIDDMKTGKLGTDYIGNKFAYRGGIKWADPGGSANVDLNVEYSRLDPFVYTHFYDINVYKNWDSSLGYFLPPNSDRWFFGVKWRPIYPLAAGLSAEFIRHGDNNMNVNAGGDIDIPPDYGQSTTVFLSGARNDITVYEFSAYWEPWPNYSLNAKLRWRDFSGGEQLEWQMIFGVNVW